MKPNLEETTQIYYEWICVQSVCEYCLYDIEIYVYIEGQSYWFHEDCCPGEHFLQVVDDNDLPIQKRVRV